VPCGHHFFSIEIPWKLDRANTEKHLLTPNGLIVVYNNDAWLRIARANLLLCTPNLRVVRVNSIKGKERRILDLSPMPRRVDGERKRSEVERLRVLSGLEAEVNTCEPMEAGWRARTTMAVLRLHCSGTSVSLAGISIFSARRTRSASESTCIFSITRARCTLMVFSTVPSR